MSAPYIAIYTDVRKDERFEVLGGIAGYNRHEALGRLTSLWAWCRDRGLQDAPEGSDGYVISEGVIVAFLGERGVNAILGGGVDDLALGVRVESGIYLRGTSEAVAALRKIARTASAGGKARAAAPRVGGKFASASCEPAGDQPATSQEPSGDQPETSREPAPTSVPPTSYLLPPDQNEPSPDARAPARATGFADRRSKLSHDAWKRASAAHHTLRTSGVDANARTYPGLPVGAGQSEIVARVLELTAGDQPDYEQAERTLAHVIAVRVAEAERTRSLRWFAPSTMWGSVPFWRAADMTVEDARSGPPAKETAATPKRPANVGRVEPSAPSEYGSGEQVL